MINEDTSTHPGNYLPVEEQARNFRLLFHVCSFVFLEIRTRRWKWKSLAKGGCGRRCAIATDLRAKYGNRRGVFSRDGVYNDLGKGGYLQEGAPLYFLSLIGWFKIL